MHSIWHSLAWKEWHEHKWKLASVTAVLASVAAAAILTEEKPQDALVGLSVMLLCIIPLALFIGLGCASTERSQGTLDFLQALPIPRWRAAVTKLAAGLITVAAGVVLAIVIVLGIVTLRSAIQPSTIDWGRATDTWAQENVGPFVTGIPYVDLTLMIVTTGTSVFLWAAAVGVNRSNEINAGIFVVLISTGWWLLFLLGSGLFASSTMIAAAVSTAPGGIGFLGGVAGQNSGRVLLGLASATIAHSLLAAWYVWRFGQTDGHEKCSPRAVSARGGILRPLAPPRHTPTTAIVWKQWRESAPIALVGLAAIFVFPAAVIVAANQSFDAIHTAEGLMVFASWFGFVVALFVGAGVMHFDLGPRYDAFWRSRPIDACSYYWTKFVVGLAILVAGMCVPLCFIAWVDWRYDTTFLEYSPVLWVIGLAQIAIYGATVGISCLVRQAIYAGILSVGAIGVAAALPRFGWMVWTRIAVGIGRPDIAPPDRAPTPEIVVSSILLAAVLFTLLGWQAFRRDWGWKG